MTNKTNLSENPLISVVMSVHNHENVVGRAIDSILNQTYKNFELLICEDFSNDSTLKIIQEFKSSKIKIFKNKKNIGLTKSLNLLIKNSTGELIARQDADDISSIYRLQQQIQFLINNDLDAVGSRSLIINTNKITPRFSFYLPIKFQMLFKNPLIHGSLMIKKSVLQNLNFYDETYYYSQDYKLLVDFINQNYKIKIMNSTLYSLNTSDNISSKNKEEQRNYFLQARKDYKFLTL